MPVLEGVPVPVPVIEKAVRDMGAVVGEKMFELGGEADGFV